MPGRALRLACSRHGNNKNSILLIDLANQLRAQGKAIDEALREACPLRPRPVLMTSMPVIIVMLPSALGLGAGADTSGPLAVAVIGGMARSTLLTLVVVPAVYSLVENALACLRGSWKRRDPANPERDAKPKPCLEE